jgi:hypothetical protein
MPSFNQAMGQRIQVDGVEYISPENTTPEQIMRAVGKDPNTTTLVTSNPHEATSKFLKTHSPIRVKNGDRFEATMNGLGG